MKMRPVKVGAYQRSLISTINWLSLSICWPTYTRSGCCSSSLRDERQDHLAANDLGLVYQATGEWERAIEFYERSSAIRKSERRRGRFDHAVQPGFDI